MSKNKIAILAVQETHLDAPLSMSIDECFGKKLLVLNSELPETPHVSAGVAFVINKTLIQAKDITTFELIKGRALAIKMKWHENDEILLLNIYTPNNKSEHRAFWKEVDEQWRAKNLRCPDFMLGDFNLTEEEIDRSPPHLDDVRAIEALRNLRQCLDVQDTWRHQFPHERCFTYRAISNGQHISSRIDRIYTAHEAAKFTFDWKMKQTSVPTDHWMVATKYAPKSSPYIGNGRWTWHIPSLEDKKLLDHLVECGIKLQNEMKSLRRSNTPREIANPQTLWKDFKKEIRKIGIHHGKESHAKLTKRSDAIEKDLKELSEYPTLDDTTRASEAFLINELAHLEKIQARDRKDNTRAALSNHGERLGGPWSAINKERKPRDLIYRLKVPLSTPAKYERDTRRMVELARNYHNDLQQKGMEAPPDSPEQATATEKALEEIPDSQKLAKETADNMDWSCPESQVLIALKSAKNGSATGLDGCPYELWKAIDTRYREDTELKKKETFNVICTLAAVFSDIQSHGVDKRSDFAEGWMCPIYKKKDPTEIENYRPITLLNTDYKLLTKTMALLLMKPIKTLIHPDQAGFIPTRQIFDHIRLAKTVLTYAETMEVDGTLVALDQEKAYDKIRHDYLWETLGKFDLPARFTNTVRSLYESAQMQVAINGVLSTPFRVTRGVRQGDPLSCLLFDLAIEPLACKIRNSEDINGLTIPGLDRKIKVNLFADDTTLYLNSIDRMDKVESILNAWCKVSGAKFNMEKTEIILMGSGAHRDRIHATRKINQLDTMTLDARIRIAKDGEAVRSLGAWIGNKANDLTPWETILDKIKNKLERWNRMHPMVFGKRIIAQAVIGGHTQFLTKAQGMPPHIEDALSKTLRDFMWDNDTHPRIALEYLHLPLNQGGLNLLDIRAQNEAIEIIWLKDYLNISPSRPTWATLTDILINATAPIGTSAIATVNTFLQTWDPPTKGPRASRLGKDTIRMLKTAKKYKTNLDALRLPTNLKLMMPSWYHLCHETTARAARLERMGLVTLLRIGFSGLQDAPGSRHGVASTVATLPWRNGQRGSVLVEA